MLCGVFFTGLVVSAALSVATAQVWSPSAFIGVGMGAFSYAANASLYKGFAVGKASIIAILTSLPAVLVAALAYVFWGETLTPWQLAAFCVILASIVMIRYSNDISLKNLQGAHWGLLALFFFAMNDLAGKQSTLSGADTFPTLFFMFLTGSALFGWSWRVERRKAERSHDPTERGNRRPWGERKVFLWGMTVGLTNAIGMILLFEAFERGVTGLVSAVLALNVLLILAYSRFFLKISFQRLEIAGMALTMAGILMLEALG